MQNKEAWLMPGFFCVKKNAIQKDGVLGKLEAKSALGGLIGVCERKEMYLIGP